MKIFRSIFFKVRPKRPWDSKSFIWKLFDAYYEQRSMWGYMRENAPCDSLANEPSKALRRRYGLSGDCNVLEVWAIIEKYCNGELIEKPKDENI